MHTGHMHGLVVEYSWGKSDGSEGEGGREGGREGERERGE